MIDSVIKDRYKLMEQGDFKTNDFNGVPFNLPGHYIPSKLIGKGTYGSVVQAEDTKNNR